MLLEAILEGRFMNCQSGLQLVIVLLFADNTRHSVISYTKEGHLEYDQKLLMIKHPNGKHKIYVYVTILLQLSIHI